MILGQDPYHGPGQAHGLCFSVQPGVRTPPSLVNIYKEMRSDLGIAPASHGYLKHWAEQGVLLLNNCLTVEAGMAASVPDDPVAGAFAAINHRMHRDMAFPAGAKPDAAFAQAMIAHHQGAIDMARVVLGFGTDPEIRKLAQDIITAQEGEIEFLQKWLARQSSP